MTQKLKIPSPLASLLPVLVLVVLLFLPSVCWEPMRWAGAVRFACC